MRLFIAIQLSKDIKDKLIDIQDEFRCNQVRGNYTVEENMHLTLAFIGDFHDPDLVLEAMSIVDFPAFPICLETIGAFRDLWWAGLSKNRELENLVKNLRHHLADTGIPFDKKRFMPHITLIRRAEIYTGFQPLDLKIPKARMLVERISLMQSTRGKHGMIYTELGAVEATE